MGKNTKEFRTKKDLETWVEKNRTHSMDIFKEKQMTKVVYLWYLLALLIYAVCTLLGFGVAYFVVKLLIELKIH